MPFGGDDNKKKVIYNAVSQDYDIGSYDEFSKKMDDPNSRQKLYNAISENFDLGDYATFNKKLGYDSQEVKPTSVRDVMAKYGITNQAPAKESTIEVQPQQSLQGEVAKETGLATEKKRKSEIPAALENSADLYFKNNGITPTKIQKEQKINDLKKGVENGHLVIGYNTVTKEPRLERKLGGIEGLIKGTVKGFNDEGKARKFIDMNPDERIKSMNEELKVDNEYLPGNTQYTTLGGLGEALGQGTPMMAKATTGAVVGGALAAAAPETAGFSTAGIAPTMAFLFSAPSAANVAYMNELKRRYAEGKQNGLSDYEAYQKADHQALVSEGVSLVTNTFLSKIPATKASGEGLNNALKEYVKSGAKSSGVFAGISAGGTALEESTAKAQGLNKDKGVIDILAESAKSGGEAGLMGLSLHVITHPEILVTLPKYLQAQVKGYISKADKGEVSVALDEMQQKGIATPEGVQSAKDELNSFDQASKKVPPNLDETTDGVIKGLIEKKNNLEAKKKELDPSFHDDINSEIEAINNKIEIAKKSDNPLHAEIDANGDALFNPKSFEDLSSKEIEGIKKTEGFSKHGTAEVVEKGEGENKTFVPKATFINESGKIATDEPIKIESDKVYKDKDKALKAAEDALAKHYYENKMQDNLKPESNAKTETQNEIIPQQANEGVVSQTKSNEGGNIASEGETVSKPTETQVNINAEIGKGEQGAEALKNEKISDKEVSEWANKNGYNISDKEDFDTATKMAIQRPNYGLGNMIFGEEKMTEERKDVHTHTYEKSGKTLKWNLGIYENGSGGKRYLLYEEKYPDQIDAGAIVDKDGKIAHIRTDKDFRSIGLAQTLLKEIKKDYGKIIPSEPISKQGAKAIYRFEKSQPTKPIEDIQGTEGKLNEGGAVSKYDDKDIEDFITNSKFKTSNDNTHQYFNINEDKQIRVTKNNKTGAGKGYHVTVHEKGEHGGYKKEYISNQFVTSLKDAKKTAAKIYFDETRKDVSNKADISDKQIDYSKVPTDELKKLGEKTNDFNEMAAIKKELDTRKNTESESTNIKPQEVDNPNVKSASEFYYEYEKKNPPPKKNNGIRLNDKGKPIEFNEKMYANKMAAYNKKFNEAYVKYVDEVIANGEQVSNRQLESIASTLANENRLPEAEKLLTKYGYEKNINGKWQKPNDDIESKVKNIESKTESNNETELIEAIKEAEELIKNLTVKTEESNITESKPKEVNNAITEGQQPESNLQQHTEGDTNGKTAETSGGNRNEPSREIKSEPPLEEKVNEGGNVPPEQPPLNEPPPIPPNIPKGEDQSTGRFEDKGILNRLNEGANVSETAKARFNKEGLKYQTASQEEARTNAKGIIDTLGYDEAILLAEAGKFNGDTNSMIFAESIDQIATKELATTDPTEATKLGAQWAEYSIRYDELARDKGRFISAIYDFYKKSPLGVVIKENRNREGIFNEWLKGKEVDYKALFDEIKKTEEGNVALKEEFESERFKNTKTYKERAKKAADTFRKLKTKPFKFKDENGNDIDIQNMGITWNDLIELGAKAIEKTGEIADGIAEIIDKIKDKDFYKALSESDKAKLQKQLEEHYTDTVEETPEAKTVRRLQKELENLQRGIVKQKGEKIEDTAEIKDLKEQIFEAKNNLGLIASRTSKIGEPKYGLKTIPDKQKISEEQKRINRLEKQLTDLEQGIVQQKADKFEDTPAIAALKDKIFEAKTKLGLISSKGKIGTPSYGLTETPESRNIRRMEKELEDLRSGIIKDKADKRPLSAIEKDLQDKIFEEKQKLGLVSSKGKVPKQNYGLSETAESKNIRRLEKELDDARNGVFKDKAEKRTLSQVEKDLQDQIFEEKKKAGLVRSKQQSIEETDYGLKTTAEEKRIEYLEKQKADLENGIIKQNGNDKLNPTPEQKAKIEKLNDDIKRLKNKLGITQKEYLERFRKKLTGLNDDQKEQVIQKSIRKLIENGALDYDDFKKIIAETLGIGQLTPEQAARMKELSKRINAMQDASKEAMTKRTPEGIKEFEKKLLEAEEAAHELDNMVYVKAAPVSRFMDVLKLNTLGIVSLVKNVSYNVWYQPILFSKGLFKTGLDYSIYGISQLANKAFGTKIIQPDTNVFLAQKDYFKGAREGLKRSAYQVKSGLQDRDYFSKEVRISQIRPRHAWKDLWAWKKGEKFLTREQFWDKLIQGTGGVNAEIIARLLNVGDKWQKFGAERAEAAQVSALDLGITKPIDKELFVKFPKEEAYRIYKKKGLSDEEATAKSEEVERRIVKAGEKAITQQDNWLNDQLAALEKWSEKKGEDDPIYNLASAIGKVGKGLTMPFVKIPLNVAWNVINFVNPEVAIGQSAFYGYQAIKYRNAGDMVKARENFRRSKDWMAHAATGIALLAGTQYLANVGAIRARNDFEEDKPRETKGETNYGRQYTINLSMVKRLATGGDIKELPDDLWVDLSWFGVGGGIMNIQAVRAEEQKQAKEPKPYTYLEDLVSRLKNSAAEGLDNGVFSGTNSLMNAYKQGGGFVDSWMLGMSNLGMNFFEPATYAQFSKSMQDEKTVYKAESGWQEFVNNQKQRDILFRKIVGKAPSDVTIWGEPAQNQKGALGTVYDMLGFQKGDPTKFGVILFQDYDRTKNTNFFPPAVDGNITVNGKIVKLPLEQARDFKVMTGRTRKSMVAPLVMGSAMYKGKRYDQLSDKDKLEALDAIYTSSTKIATDDFKNKYPEYQEKTDILKDVNKSMDDVNKDLLLMQVKPK